MKTIQSDGAQLKIYCDAPDWNGKTMAVAQLEFESVGTGAALLEQAVKFASEQGAVSIIGPMEGDTWHSYRLPTEGNDTPAFFMEPTCGEHDLEVFKKAGFCSISNYFSASVPLCDVNCAVAQPQEDLIVTAWDGNEAQSIFSEVHELSCEAFARNAFYKSIELKEFLSMYMPLVPYMKPELMFLARDSAGKLQGFLFGIPNHAEGENPDSVILKTYASLRKGAGYLLSSTFYAAAQDAGYKTAIHALMHDDNLSALRSATNGADIFRHYALMGRSLDN